MCVFDIPTCTLNPLRSPGQKKNYGTRPGECHAEGALLPERLVREENAGADAERQRWTGDHGSWCNSTSGFILWYPLRNTYINRHSTWEFVSVSFRTWASGLKILSQRIFSQNLAVQLAPRQTQVTCPNCARVTSLGRTMCRSSATFLPGNLGGIVWLFGWSDVAEWGLMFSISCRRNGNMILPWLPIDYLGYGLNLHKLLHTSSYYKPEWAVINITIIISNLHNWSIII